MTRRLALPTSWEPNPGPQALFVAETATEVLYGGAAGGGKTDALIFAPGRWLDEPTFNALILRTTYREIEEVLEPRSHKVFKAISPGARYVGGDKHLWTFPSGARLRFGYLDRDDQVYQYQGAEFQYIGWDELTHFTEFQYRYLMSRLRGTAGLPKWVRAGSNPGGPGADWVQRRWAPWLGMPPGEPEWTGPLAEPNQTLWYVNTREGEVWVPEGTPHALSRCFIPAKLADNPKVDPGYEETLMGMDALTRAQLLEGNWMARAAAGVLFKRGWFKFVDAAPLEGQCVRFWDRAATEEIDEKGAKNNPDWTVGVRMRRTNDRRLWVEDVVRLRGTPHTVRETIRATAELDTRKVEVWISKDPGQAGEFEFEQYSTLLQGFNVYPLKETGDKIERAQPFSAQVEAGNVTLIRGDWNEKYLHELEAFPTKNMKDDQVDASSGAFNAIVEHVVPRLGKIIAAPRPSPRGIRF